MKKLSYLLASLLLSLWSFLALPVTTVAAADTCTWTGANSADWSDGGNWSGCDNGGVPENGDSLVFPSGSDPTSNNDIAGTLTLDQIDVTGDNYAITGNAIEISGYLQFTGNNNNFNMADMTFANASTGTSLVINGTGNTITNAIGLNMSGGHDFNIYTNQDFTAPLFSGGSIGNFNKQGSANLTTSTSASTFTATGAVNVTDGLFICNNANCGGVGANNIQTLSTGSLVLEGANITEIYHDLILGSTASPQLNKLAGNVEVSGNVTINTTGSILVQSGDLELSGNVNNYTNAAITVNSGGDIEFSGTLNINSSADNITATGTGSYTDSNIRTTGTLTGDGSLSFNGVGGYLLASAAGYNGDIYINSGSLVTAIPAGLGSTTGVTEIADGGVLRSASSPGPIVFDENIIISGNGNTSGSYNNGAFYNEGAAVEFTGTITLAGNTTFTANNLAEGDIDFQGPVDGTGDLTLQVIAGTGALTMSGSDTNSYSGKTLVNGGDLYLNKTGGLGITGDIDLNSTPTMSATLSSSNNGGNQIADNSKITLTNNGANAAQFYSDVDTEVVGTVEGNGHLEADGPGTGFTIGGSNMSGTFMGTIDNEEGTITKTGTGTWTLDGVTQPGFGTTFNFVVNDGKVVWNSTLTDAPITINSGGVLKGNGTVGTTTVNTGGTIAAGNSPGCITVSNLTLGAGSTFEEEIAGGSACTEYDRTNVNGNANLGGATLSVLPSYTPTPGTVYTILQTTNGNVIGTFNGLADGATFTANGIQFRINYTNTQVNLTVLGGTLVPTGQNHNGIAFLALAVLILGLGGVYFALRRNKFTIQRTTL